MKDNKTSSETENTVGDQFDGFQGRAVQWQEQTIEELCRAIPLEEQMIVSILAAAWRPEVEVWDKDVLKCLLESFARDVSTSMEHKIATTLKLIDSGNAVVDALAATETVSDLTGEALGIAIAKRQLAEFFSCWRKRPLVPADLIPHERTFPSKLMRLAITATVILYVFTFIMLFIIPEFQKMFDEFGLELTPVSQFVMAWADRTTKLWFIPALALLALGVLFFRGSSFSGWTRRWSPRSWTATNWQKRDRARLMTAWAVRPGGTIGAVMPGQPDAGAESTDVRKADSSMSDTWEQRVSSAGVLTKSETKALSTTNNLDLKDWLLEKMVSDRQEKRARTSNGWATILLGAGHCFLGVVVILVAISIFGSLLSIIDSLSGVRP